MARVDEELSLRFAAIAYVLALRQRWVVVPAAELKRFSFEGREIYLKGIQGVFKPKELALPLSLASTLSSPYTDQVIGSRILYDYAPRSIEEQNEGVKECARRNLPLIYLTQVKPKPAPEWEVFAPVYVDEWSDDSRQFVVDLSEQLRESSGLVTPRLADAPLFGSSAFAAPAELRKQYVESAAKRRLHQAKFRNQVLGVYSDRCAVCVLRVRPLLDAAHVVPDREPTLKLVVNDGLALCATHHRAFDAKVLTYDDDYRVRVELPRGMRAGEGEESMLLAFDGRRLTLPENEGFWPVVVAR